MKNTYNNTLPEILLCRQPLDQSQKLTLPLKKTKKKRSDHLQQHKQLKGRKTTSGQDINLHWRSLQLLQQMTQDDNGEFTHTSHPHYWIHPSWNTHHKCTM